MMRYIYMYANKIIEYSPAKNTSLQSAERVSGKPE